MQMKNKHWPHSTHHLLQIYCFFIIFRSSHQQKHVYYLFICVISINLSIINLSMINLFSAYMRNIIWLKAVDKSFLLDEVVYLLDYLDYWIFISLIFIIIRLHHLVSNGLIVNFDWWLIYILLQWRDNNYYRQV